MHLNLLTPINQYNEGDDIWVFADIQNSKALKKIDWYLNFQMFNSNFKQLETTMVLCHKKLPTKAIVSVPYNGDIKHWCNRVNKAWLELNSPSIRVFLPDNFKNTSELKFDSKLSTVNVVQG